MDGKIGEWIKGWKKGWVDEWRNGKKIDEWMNE